MRSKEKKEGEDGGLDVIPKPSFSDDVILGNSQSVTRFLFLFLPPSFCQNELVSAKIKRIAMNHMTFEDNSKNIIVK